MREPFDHIEIKYRTISGGQLLYALDYFLDGEFAQGIGFVGLDIVCGLQIVGPTACLHAVVVDGGVDHDTPHPGDERGAGLIAPDVAKNLDKAFVEDIHGVIVAARIPDTDSHEEAVILFIELFLGPAFLRDARFYEVPFLLLEADRNTHNREVISGIVGR